MDFLQNAQKQFSDLFESMTPASRITAGLLLAAVVVGLLFLFNFSTSAPDELLLGGAEFVSSDLQSMEAAFSQEQLNTYERVGNRFRIPRGQRNAYVAALAKHKALPSDFHDAFEKSLNEGGVFEPSKMRDSRQKLAKQRELSMIISAMNGVERATVQFDEQIAASFPRTVHKTAVVAVMPKGSAALEDSLAESIVDFLVHAIAGLKSENVTVTDLKANRSIVGGGMLGAGGSARNPYPAMKAFHENQWSQKIRTLLAGIPGAAVSVNVELDPVLHREERKTQIDPKPVPLSITSKSTTISSNSGSPGGRPGVVSNTSNAPAAVSGGMSRSQSEDTKTESQQNVPSVETTVSSQHGMTPTRVSVSVALPTEYYLQTYRQRNPPAAGQPAKKPDPNELEGLEKEIETRLANMITPLLPKRPPGVDPYPQVVITRLPELPTAEVITGGFTDDMVSWLHSNWSTIAMLGIGLFGLVTFRGMLSAMPTPPEPRAEREPATGPRLAAESSSDETPNEGGESSETPARRRRRAEDGGPNLRDELVEIVKEDPDAAAKILRSWIGEAA